MLRFFFSLSLTLQVCAGLATPSASLAPPAMKPYYTYPVDYSAANEFISEHYYGSDRELLYFRKDKTTEPIYNAREGYMDRDGRLQSEPCLSKCGFELVQLKEDIVSPNQVDWDDLTSIRDRYLNRLEEVLRSSLDDDVDIYFWNPTIRCQDSKDSDRKSDLESHRTTYSIQAGMVHIDSDVNAYEITDFLNIVAANIVPGTTPLPVETVAHDLTAKKQRFCIYNAWRNIGSQKVQQAPLALLPMRYTDESKVAFPIGAPDFVNSHWYTFPEMEPNEVLLFAQYDRDAAVPSDVWHCALTSVGANDATVPPRKSLDVRAFVVHKDRVVPECRDRLAHRVTSMLDFKQSQIFCHEQGERRKQKKS